MLKEIPMLSELIGPDIAVLVKENRLDDVTSFLTRHHPAEDAELLSELKPDEIQAVLKRLDSQTAADIFCKLPSTVQVDVAEDFDRPELITLLEKLSPDDRADLAKALPEEQMDDVLPFLAQKERDDIRKLTAWAEGTAGSVMTTDYVAFPESLTVKQALERIRLEGAKKEAVSIIYILDAGRKLSGYLTLEDLILAKPDSRLAAIKKRLVAEITASADREEAVYKISRYGLMVLPVVDEAGTLIGIITHDDAIDVIEQERTEDMERFMAIAGKHQDTSYLQTSIWTHFSHRILWLVILAALDLVSGAVVQSYETSLSKLILLAFYMPMLADTGGNTGSQSSTVIVRALALKEIKPRDACRVVWKELRIAVLMGLVLALLAFLRVEFTGSSSPLPAALSLSQVGLAISLALAVQVISATIIGAVLPLIAAAFKLDPALVASPALTTIVDITGLLIYFGTAHLLLHI